MEDLSLQTEIVLKETGRRIKLMDMGHTYTRMGPDILGNGSTTSKRVKVRSHGLMEANTLETIGKARKTERVVLLGLMVQRTKASGAKIRCMESGCLGGLTAEHLKGSTKTTKNMVLAFIPHETVDKEMDYG